MGLDSVIRAGIKTLDSATKGLQAYVTHEAWIGRSSGRGPALFASGVQRYAIVEPMHRMHHLPDGRTVEVIARLIFLAPVPANGAAERIEPIDHRDKLTLPDGTTGPIVDIKGITDPTTNKPYFGEVMLGRP